MVFLAAALLCGSHPVYALRAIVSPVAIRREAGEYRASASLRFEIVPKPATPHTSDRGFNDHVRGHQIIAQRVARSSIGSTQATGKTAAEARSQLLRAIAQMSLDAQKELDREERVYDSVTEDGQAQDQAPQYGFPGGANAKDRCPQR
ncbi:MAG TPA: hypothetical protein VFL13_14315 [Candidatus Baltobacteraceae bacterium]|nr:hypothetical protein [Candidatus Baltobacteraceae bacterium]